MWSCLKICRRRLWKQDGRRQTNPRNTAANAFPLARLQVSAQRRGAALDKTQPEAQIPGNPANHRTSSVVTGRRRVVGNQ
jgi:hypothetical protein